MLRGEGGMGAQGQLLVGRVKEVKRVSWDCTGIQPVMEDEKREGIHRA